jgi:class 3 adenylate cyclase
MQCPKCQTELFQGAKFCFECGINLHAPAFPPGHVPEPSKPHLVPEPERKFVTALFSDLTGYTSMTEKLDPEQVKEITSRIFSGVKGIVAKYEGFIERVMGDGCLAFFGIPRAHEDDPIRAIHAAMEIHGLVKGLSPQYEARVGAPLSMHSGVNSGLVVTADVDPEKGTHGVAGDAVNVASRLSGMAGPGEIFVGEETVRRARGRFVFNDLGQKLAKGKTEPVSVFKVISVKASGLGTGVDRKVSSEMVGRDKELDRLELQVMKAINGDGSVVNVIGEAGIGKSRLIAELKKREVMKRVTLLEGRAISIGKNLSFHPIIDLLKQWGGISEADSEAAAFAKLEKAIRQVHSEETNEILPFVATLMGMKLTGKHAERVKGIEGEALEKLIFKNVRELVIKGAELRPTVVVMEDLHWSDTSSIELLDALCRLAEKHRIAFVNVFRPGYFESDDGKIASIGTRLPDCYVEITIQPLDRNDSETLIDNMLAIRGLPYTFKHQITERSGGNPFFIEEVVRSLIDEGAVVKRDVGFEVTAKIEKVVIPPSINDVLMARIDRLEERTRELVKVASVIGRSFFDRIIKDVADSIGDVDHRLEYLKDVQLIRDRIRMQELEYLFKHALAQEAAYESTLIQQRKTLHLKVAQSIERVFQEKLHEFYGMLAYHYSKADDLEKAEEYMVKAGEEALRSSASSEALHYYQEGLRLYLDRYSTTADPEKIATFEKNIGIALYNKAKWAEAMEYLEMVLERWGAPVPKPNLKGALHLVRDLVVVLKTLYFPSSKVKPVSSERENEIFDLMYKIATLLPFIDITRHFFHVMAGLRRATKYDVARIPYGFGWWRAGYVILSYSGISFKLADRLMAYSLHAGMPGDTLDKIQYACMAAIGQSCRGAWNEIEKVDHHLIDQGLRCGDLYHTSTYMCFHGLVKAEQGEFHQSRDVIERLFQKGETYDYVLATFYAHLLKADLLIKKLSFAEALVESEEGVSSSREQGTELQGMTTLGYKGEAQFLLGDAVGSQETISTAREIHDKQKFVAPLFAAAYMVARFLSDIYRLQQEILAKTPTNDSNIRRNAYRSGKAALRNARKYAPYRTKIFRLMGLYYWLIGKQRKALKWWDKSIKEGERLGARPDLSRTYFEVGKRLLEPQSKYKQLNGIDAKGYLEKAERLFREMGLEHDLDELERVRSQM